MTAPFNDSELTQIDQPDDLNDSGFDGPWNQDFESTTYLPIFPYQKQISHFVMKNTAINFKIISLFKFYAFLQFKFVVVKPLKDMSIRFFCGMYDYGKKDALDFY